MNFEKYQQINDEKRNFREMDDASVASNYRNQGCGDGYRVFLKIEGDRIVDASYTTTGCGFGLASLALVTELAKGKETREIDGRMYVFETPIHADFALIKAERGDRWGNLTYRKTARNFGPIMAMAAKTTVASVHEIVPLGELDPEAIITPGIFVQRVVKVARTATGPAGFKQAA